MPLTLTQTTAAVAANCPASFLGVGGTAPYTYAVLSGGPGGAIDAGTGVYTAPAVADALLPYDTVQVTDSLAAVATAQILVGSPLLLLCDIIQSELGLANGRVYLWDQKIMQPTDSDLYVAVGLVGCKPFGNSNRISADGTHSEQYVAMQATVDIDVISRGPAARDRKEEIILALESNYSRRQQDANSFYVGKIPPSGRFLNLSEVDGAAIPYRYKISIMMQYAVSKTTPTPYFDTFQGPNIFTNP